MITTYAGTGEPGYRGDSGKATAAELDRPHGWAVDTQGNLCIADNNDRRVRVVGA